MLSDEWLPRYRLLENFNIKWNGNGNGNAHGNGNAYDRGDYNSSFALRAVELKTKALISYLSAPLFLHMQKAVFFHDAAHILHVIRSLHYTEQCVGLVSMAAQV